MRVDSEMSSTLETMTMDITEHLKTLHSLVTSALNQAMKAFEDIDVKLAAEAGAVSERSEHMHHLIEGLVFEIVSEAHMAWSSSAGLLCRPEALLRLTHRFQRPCYRVITIS